MSKIEKIVYSIFISIYFIFLIFLYTFNYFYQDIYDNPKIENGVLNCEGYSLEGRGVGYCLCGEWDFYYGKLIYKEGLDDIEKTGVLPIPSKWTFKDKQYQAHTNASYGLTVLNIPKGVELTISYANQMSPVIAYMNDVLVFSNENGIFKDVYVSTGEDIRIIVEVEDSWSGLRNAPYLCLPQMAAGYWNALDQIVLIFLGIVVASCLLSLLLFISFYRYHHDPSFMLLIFTFSIHFLFSSEVLGLWMFPSIWLSFLNRLTAVFVILSILYFLLKRKPISKKVEIAYSIFVILSLLTYFLLSVTDYALIPILLVFTSTLLFIPNIFYKKGERTSYKIILSIIVFMMIITLTFEQIDELGILVFGTNYFFTTCFVIIVLLLCEVYFYQIYMLAKNLKRIGELEHLLSLEKQSKLAYQVQPHFIFNSLNAIESIYHKSLEQGDEALNHFSHHLRANIDLEQLIDFNDELVHIDHYVELEKLKREVDFNFLVDIEFDNFKVPALSIEPFVENAIRYAQTEKKKDGFISIHSYKEEEYIIVEIEDNGIGFDLSTTEFHVGLTNAVERLKLTLSADVMVESHVGIGTNIKIKIPM